MRGRGCRRSLRGGSLPVLLCRSCQAFPPARHPRASSGETPSGLYHYVGLDQESEPRHTGFTRRASAGKLRPGRSAIGGPRSGAAASRKRGGLARLPLTQRPGGRVIEAQVLDLLDGGLPASGRLREVDRGVVRTRQAVLVDFEFGLGLISGCPQNQEPAVVRGTVVGEPPAAPRRRAQRRAVVADRAHDEFVSAVRIEHLV